MEKVESALDVLSRAATMVQPCPYPSSDSEGFETPSTGSSESEGDRTVSPEAPRLKEGPGKWRRERKAARLPEYRPRENGNKATRSQSFKERRAAGPAAGPRPGSDGDLSDEEAPSPAANGRGAPPSYPGGRHEAPVDMRLRTRPAPPPYSRVSVIRSQEPAGSMSMCDPVIDEHFRRSLGDDYMTLFKKDEPQPGPKPNTKDRASSPIQFHQVDPPKPAKIIAMEMDDANLSVDDHFAKALGDTWKQLQTSRSQADEPKVSQSKVVDDHFSKALGDRWKEIQSAKKPGDEAKITSRNGVVI